MGRIPETTLQEVRDRVDIVDLVGRHVTLRRAGRSFKGLCPFHDEKTPSFHVNPERGFFHCFGCGVGGNAFDFLIRHENLTFPEAVRTLAAELGIEVPESDGSDAGHSERLLRACLVAQDLYREALASPAGAGAREYLAGRGLDAETIDRFGVGFAPDRWDAVRDALGRERISATDGTEAGVLRERSSGDGHYDLLRGRVVFPIHDARERIVAFGGRALADGQEPKYLNSPETPLFRKREALYGLPFAREAVRERDRIVVVEGYFDCIALHRAGIQEAVASCGTALGEGHARGLRRRVRNVTLLFDGDEAGQRAVLRALDLLLPAGLRVRAAALPVGEDPDDFLAKRGPEALRALVDAAPPALDLAIGRAVAAGCSTPWEKADAVALVAPLLARVPEAVERGEFARRLALAAGAAEADVLTAVRAAARHEPAAEALGAPRAPMDPREEHHLEEIVRILLAHPGLAAASDCEPLLDETATPAWRALLPALVAACARAGERDPIACLEAELEGDARDRLVAIASDPGERFEDPTRAARALQDSLHWFERRRLRERQRRTTDLLRATGSDATAVLVEKNRELARRRAALPGGPPG